VSAAHLKLAGNESCRTASLIVAIQKNNAVFLLFFFSSFLYGLRVLKGDGGYFLILKGIELGFLQT
jgi:hypothetical protein